MTQGEEIVKQEPHLSGHCQVAAPEVKVLLVPEFMRRAGSQADQILLNPRERRQIMEFERWVGKGSDVTFGCDAEW